MPPAVRPAPGPRQQTCGVTRTAAQVSNRPRRVGQCGQGFGGERPAKQLGANLVPFTTYAAKKCFYLARSARTEERRRSSSSSCTL